MICYSQGHCTLGPFLAVWSANGLHALELADTQDQLLAWLDRTFPLHPFAPTETEDPTLAQRIQVVLDTPDSSFKDLPLSPDGTQFQKRVWQTIQDIPAGQSLSYAQIARKLGKPGAARAVANACGANPIAVLIPCHRVIRSDGKPGGYRWGLARKKALLERETCPVSP